MQVEAVFRATVEIRKVIEVYPDDVDWADMTKDFQRIANEQWDWADIIPYLDPLDGFEVDADEAETDSKASLLWTPGSGFTQLP